MKIEDLAFAIIDIYNEKNSINFKVQVSDLTKELQDTITYEESYDGTTNTKTKRAFVKVEVEIPADVIF